jgi:PAP2 superfamily
MHVTRGLAVLIYIAVASTVVHSIGGAPASLDILVPLLVGLLLAISATSLGRFRRTTVALAVDWAPFVLSLWLYDMIRGYADGMWMPIHYVPQIRIDRALGFGTVPTVWLQRQLWHGGDHLQWWDYAAWATYMSYFFVPALTLGVLWWRSRAAFRELAVMVVALAWLGCATFVFFPAAPPWFASHRRHRIAPVTRLIDVINRHIPLVSFQPLWEKGTQYANNVAAIPSLHAGFTLLIALFFMRRWRSRCRYALLLYPLAMLFALVYTAEHYVTDVLVGWLYAAAVFTLVLALERRVSSRFGPRAVASYAPTTRTVPDGQ